MDTGSKHNPYWEWVTKFTEANDNFSIKRIPNIGHYLASMKYVMHTASYLMNNHEYYLFHIDDEVSPNKATWANDLINILDKVDGHAVYGIGGKGPKPATPETDCWENGSGYKPYIHGQYYCMSRKTLKHLASQWYTYDKANEESAIKLFGYENTVLDHVSNAEWPVIQKQSVHREIDVAVRFHKVVPSITCIATDGSILKYKEL